VKPIGSEVVSGACDNVPIRPPRDPKGSETHTVYVVDDERSHV